MLKVEHDDAIKGKDCQLKAIEKDKVDLLLIQQ